MIGIPGVGIQIVNDDNGLGKEQGAGQQSRNGIRVKQLPDAPAQHSGSVHETVRARHMMRGRENPELRE
jgi:hypothetical protein